jgi:hypothetical protein
MRIDFEIAAHLGEEVASDLFPSIFEGGEFLAEIQPAMASLSLSSHERTGDVHLSCEPPHTALKLRALHYRYCRTVLSEGQDPVEANPRRHSQITAPPCLKC